MEIVRSREKIQSRLQAARLSLKKPAIAGREDTRPGGTLHERHEGPINDFLRHDVSVYKE
jgi:hypothetical protein